ncbi:glycosyl transferase [Desulfuromonas versatilis]|uniref:Glycosyl transferase n=1 Tax=Desulfuromonas versatilis TaxID=2802975 RepID=A0ABM8HSP9_9BACT|nr:glycosyltransferase [Desulfuromonas versatilis]BCR06045.1 glycosyl transferase [Desulfuromonas versatilis]
MRKTGIFIVLLVVLANLGIWAYANQPKEARDWRGEIRGFSFSPFGKDQDPFEKKYPSVADIDRDLTLLATKANRVRSYSSAEGQEHIPAVAQAHGLKVTAGAWLDRDLDKNRMEIEQLIVNTNSYHSVERAMVGNEVILRGDLSVAELGEYIAEVRAATKVPVGTAEPWHVWLKHPELAGLVDFIAIHILPYWEGVPADKAIAWTQDCYDQVARAFPGKPVIIGEVGWPSAGPRWEKSEPSVVNQARFVREFLNLAAEKNYDYFLMEAIDQPWKKALEGRAGAHWGMFDADRQPKYPLIGEVVEQPLWPWQFAVATLLALCPMVLFLRNWDNLKRRGQLFFAVLIQVAASMFAWTAFLPITTAMTPAGLTVWGVLLPAQAALLLVVLTNGLEMSEILWVQRWRRRFLPVEEKSGGPQPKVSIHLAIYNEPPELVFQTLDGLSRLDYPDFEVLVIDNNTAREEVWRPVEEYCARLGERFRFFHLPKWPGYKAGALNFGMSQTHPDAAIVGVIDSDYVVSPDWLSKLVPYFDRPEVGFVQAPQDNREWQGDLFKTMINWEYNGFFQIGMVHRNERNAIIQHGTMTLVRRTALNEVGNWGEWCICEDAELGLRLFEAGYESVYVNHDFGHGVVPTSFAGYKGQRFRWTYGAVQILRRHWRALLPWNKSGLTLGQKFHFATGWLPWFTDAMHLLFTFAGVFWTVGMLLLPHEFEIPLQVFLVPTLGLFVFKVMHALVLYRARVRCTFWQSVGAAIAGMGLTHTIARAIFNGLWTSSKPFLRTPKGEGRPAVFQGVAMAWEETQIMLLLWLTAVASLWFFGLDNVEGLLWAALLLVQSIPYASALLTSLASTLPRVHLVLPRFGSGLLRMLWNPRPRRTPMG